MFSRAGFLHFVELHHDPLGVLDAELEAAGEVKESLIVLPEAFNLGRPYGSEPEKPCAFGRDFLIAALQTRSQKHSVTFIAGIIGPHVGGGLPYSSAYLIDGSDSRLLCHKHTQDYSGHYEPFPGDCDVNNPTESKGVSIAAMICKDIEEHRCQSLTALIAASPAEQRFICIPAAMRFSGWLYNSDPSAHINFGPPAHDFGTRIILANSLATGPCSFVTDTRFDVATLVPKARKHHNFLMLAQLAPLQEEPSVTPPV